MIWSTKFSGVAILVAVVAAIPSQAGSIAIIYNLSGTGNVVDSTATTLTLDATASGSLMSGIPALDALWNPISYTDESVLDFTTNLLHGNFVLMLQDGDTLIGIVDEDQTIPDTSAEGTGAFPQTLTFTGGTGAFAGATGLVSAEGFLGTTDFTVSGSGVINTPSSGVPEPASGLFLFSGLVGLVLARPWCSKIRDAKATRRIDHVIT